LTDDSKPTAGRHEPSANLRLRGEADSILACPHDGGRREDAHGVHGSFVPALDDEPAE
jgi:hypothetical protein